jgi:hypothetical protein
MPEPVEVKQSKVSLKEEKVKAISEEDKEGGKDGNKISGSGMQPQKKAATEADGVGIKPSFLDGLLNDGIMPEPLEVKQSKVSVKVEEVKTKSKEDKESDKDGKESSGSGMTMLLAGLRYEG